MQNWRLADSPHLYLVTEPLKIDASPLAEKTNFAGYWLPCNFLTSSAIFVAEPLPGKNISKDMNVLTSVNGHLLAKLVGSNLAAEIF